MKAIIQLDVPDWQIGQDVTVYFPDTMMEHAKCELLKEQKAIKIEVKKINNSGRCGRCPNCLMELNEVDYPNYCGNCGQKVKWK